MNLKSLLCGMVSRLRFVTRYTTCRVIHSETVAEHSYYVALYAYMICLWVRENEDCIIDIGTCVARALVHDMEEARSGDFLRTFKHSDPALTVMLADAGARAFGDVVNDFVLDTDIAETLHTDWSNAKDTLKFEGCIVAFADYLSVLSYFEQERAVGNRDIAEHTGTLAAYADQFDTEQYDFIRPLVRAARIISTEVLGNGR